MADVADFAVDAVLFSPDLWPVLWPSLHASTKRALRGVCSAMRQQVDAAIVVVASSRAGFSPAELTGAITRWPGVRHLTLLGVCDAASTLAPLATASLADLESLTVREAHLPGLNAYWGFVALGSSVAAKLQVVDFSCCYNLTSIDGVRSCAQLRCLRMAYVSVPDLSPLGACSQLEELWMAGDFWRRSLAPLKACPRLRKLDLRYCRRTLRSE
ncbi:hypothetical protein FOA52_014180 [Chlamydomonas sp. UWO 241]|nr:hypothetical protein FOA52_014180 [Chlamydomonas sp. UWO 241]